MCSKRFFFLFALLSAAKAGNPAGNGYQSPKWRLPKWKPAYDMRSSTIIMVSICNACRSARLHNYKIVCCGRQPCNMSGWHNLDEATRYGIVDYDWSNAKQLWANTKPMDAQERLVTQADSVLAKTGNKTQIWVYRNASECARSLAYDDFSLRYCDAHQSKH